MDLNQWAIRWSIPPAALDELRGGFTAFPPSDPPYQGSDSEAAVQSRVRLEASRKGLRIWRNNLGAVTTDDGRFIRYGLANESKRMNTMIKSSDLIGIRPLKITSEYLGRIVGQFVAREVKPTKWVYKATEREGAQLRFLQLVAAYGGDAAFATGEGTL